MRRAGLTFLMILMIATLSAFAQRKSAKLPTLKPTPSAQDISVQSEKGVGFLVINTATGEYKCTFCEYDYTLTGTGEVLVLGCNVYFSDIQDGYRVFATIDMCAQQGKVAADMFEAPGLPKQDPISETWTDYNVQNNTLACPKKPM